MPAAQKPVPGTVHVERWVAAQPAEVFAAWTTSAGLSRWWAAGTAYRTGEMIVEPRVGGTFRLEMEHIVLPVRHVVGGEVLVFEENRHLAVSWSWLHRPEPSTSRVVMTCVPDGTGTRLCLDHHFPNGVVANEHQRGWRRCVAQLLARCFPNPAPEMSTVIRQVVEQGAWFHHGVTDCDDKHWRTSPGSAACGAWLATHMLDARQALIQLLGGTCERPWQQIVSTGRPPAPVDDLPSSILVRESFALTETILLELLQALTASDLTRDVLGEDGIQRVPLLQAIQDWLRHDVYHVGQIGYWRRAIGLAHPAGMP